MQEPYDNYSDYRPTYIKSSMSKNEANDETGQSSPTEQFVDVEPVKEMFLAEFAKSPLTPAEAIIKNQQKLSSMILDQE